MQRQMLKSKIHRAAVTGCDPDYVGSITLDPELMGSADLLANEQVDVDSYAPIVVHVGERNEIVRVFPSRGAPRLVARLRGRLRGAGKPDS